MWSGDIVLMYILIILSIAGDSAFCPVIFLPHPNKPRLDYSNALRELAVVDSLNILRLHQFSRIQFARNTTKYKDVPVSFGAHCSVHFGYFDSQLEFIEEFGTFLPLQSALNTIFTH